MSFEKFETARGLNNLNKDFYERASLFWNHNHDNWWEGWYSFDLTDRLNSCNLNSDKIFVLDIGCGTGKFASFVKNSFPENFSIDYVGVDFSKSMLKISNSIQVEFNNFNLIEFDLINKDLKNIFPKIPKNNLELVKPKFEVVALIGFLHHVFDFEKRLEVLQNASDLVSENGILIWSCFEYLKSQRLSKRIIYKDDYLTKWAEQKFNFKYKNLQKGDNLLGWVKKTEAVRYSHAFDDEEINNLHSSLKNLKNEFILLDDYYADGKNGKQNRYFILKKVPLGQI